MSRGSMRSLMPTAMPSIGESWWPWRQRLVAMSAASRAAPRLRATKAPIFGSQISRSARQRSRKSRGVSRPAAKAAVCGREGRIMGVMRLLFYKHAGCRSPPPASEASGGGGAGVGGAASTDKRLTPPRALRLLALVVVVDLVEHAALLGLEGPMIDTGRAAGVGRGVERLAALALRVVADDEVAL